MALYNIGSVLDLEGKSKEAVWNEVQENSSDQIVILEKTKPAK